ncbi:MAG: LysE family translocator [Rhodobacteraceae bacterium]|jgi:threonine efflux protein|nr:LysE family translocator [Paracoccaceae bacterium]
MENDVLLGLIAAGMGFALAALSPGQNMAAVASTGLGAGRRPALLVASGIATGAFFWSLSMSYGLARLFEAYPWSLRVLSYVGGGYLLYLAWKALRAAIRGGGGAIAPGEDIDGFRAWGHGLAVTATNPKVALFWASIATFVTSLTTVDAVLFAFALVIALEAMVIYGGYAILFSASRSRQAYNSAQSAFEAGFGVVFGVLGVILIT